MLTLTPNRRLAAFLTREHNNLQIAAGKSVWPASQILHLKGWFAQLWQTCVEAVGAEVPCYPIINDVQQQLVWEDIIRTSTLGVELLRIPATAKNTIQAWKFLRQWRVSVPKLAAYAPFSTDTQAFYTWLQSYLEWLQFNKYTDFDLMIDDLTTYLPKYVAKIPPEICLMGVDELTPQQAEFFKQLKILGVHITEQSMLQQPYMIQLHNFGTKQDEFTAAAHWAQQRLQDNKQQIIAVVVPNLEMQRAEVVRTFSNLIPANLMNISAPLGLASFGIIEHALLILQLCKTTFAYEDFSVLLRSPFINAALAEVHGRSQSDRILRENVEAKLTWDNLTSNIQRANSKLVHGCTTFEQLTQTMPSIIALTIEAHKPSVWVTIFRKILDQWGWPGARGVTQAEMDLLSCWRDLLNSYCNFDILGQAYTYQQALQLLQRLASETPFLPAETGATRLHILGVLEAAGICFDQLWVTGMDRDSWPPDAAPNPFIPGEIQRQFDMPRSSPQRELKVARRLTANLKHGAKQAVHFSYAAVIDDHATTVSNLLTGITVTEYQVASVTATPRTALESIEDHNAPALVDNVVKSGTAVLKLQALCPFKAFAETRLLANKLETPQLILNAAERGKIVHAVLEEFWKKCDSQAQLTAWLPSMLQKVLAEIVANVLAQWQRKFPITLNANYVALEKTRLNALLQRWLEYELQRTPFTVTAIEQKIIVTIGSLVLSVRADRIDTLTTGKVVIVDYKTGVTQTGAWFHEAITEPQMPLYAIATQNQIAAVVFANIVSQHDKLKFSGVANSAVVPDVKVLDYWDELLTTWRAKLTDVAQDFAKGDARVQPLDEKVCQSCNLQALCRIYDC